MNPNVDPTNEGTQPSSPPPRKTPFVRYRLGLLVVLLVLVREWLLDLTWLGKYPVEETKARTRVRSSTHHHVVFIGDSLLRNAYLEWVDQIHFHRRSNSSAPDELIHEQLHGSWTEYIQYTTTHFQGYMSCDCRPGRKGLIASLNSNIENRYYSRGSVTATYLQGYGDYAAHGRYQPVDLPKAQVSNTDAPPAETTPPWEYRGLDWDQLILNYVSQLTPKPTAIVVSAGGMWPSNDISLNMGSILQAAKRVVGEEGTVIWREAYSRRWNNGTESEGPSPADQAARDWAYRIPDVLYQPFPSSTTRRTWHGNWSDRYPFDEPRFYRYWNNLLTRALWDRPALEHVAFVVVGAVRSLPQTHHTMMQNLVRKLCPPYRCVAHLILHLSGADNRPDRANPDPLGVAFRSSENHTTYFQHPDQYDWPHDFLRVHYVDESYEIGSPEEQAAMDQYEREYIQDEVSSLGNSSFGAAIQKQHDLLRRFHVIRFGDPRRYSMWFARAWAWRYAKKINASFDYYVFTRPDLLWYLPLPTLDFFRDFAETDKEIWVHDRYFNDVPDTFALLSTRSVAEKYLSLRYLLHPRVACLGGPDFDQAVVAERLRRVNITVIETDWCPEAREGWSEMILRHKIEYAQLHKRWFPAGVTIWRPPAHARGFKRGALLCEPVHKKFVTGWVRFARTNIPFYGCVIAMYAVENNWTALTSSGQTYGGVLTVHFIRWRSRDEGEGSCLARVQNGDKVASLPEPCEDPIPVDQIYATIPDDDHHWLGLHLENQIYVVDATLPAVDRTAWFPEPVDMYSVRTLADVKH